MSTFRVEKNKNYTVISNYHLRDKRLSSGAVGLLSVMLSLPEDWDYTMRGLAYIRGEGIDAIRAMLRNLEECGYVTYSRVRDEHGQLRGTDYIIREIPEGFENGDRDSANRGTPENTQVSPKLENPILDESGQADFFAEPILDSPMLASPILANPTQQNKDILNNNLLITYSDLSDRSGEPEKNETVEETDVEAQIRENIGYDMFESPEHLPTLNGIVALIAAVLRGKREHLRIGGKDVPAGEVKKRLLALRLPHVAQVLDALSHIGTVIRNRNAYLLTALYNAVNSGNCTYADATNAAAQPRPDDDTEYLAGLLKRLRGNAGDLAMV